MDFDSLPAHDRVALQQRLPKKENMAHVIPRFYEEMVRTNELDENGLPKFRSIEYVELLIAGDRGNAPVKRVNDAIRQQFHDAYGLWKSKKVNPDMVGDGIPLGLWPLIPQEMVKALEFINVFTVQQLAAVSDQAASKPGAIGLREMREKAKAFLDSAKSAAPIAKLEIENKNLNERVELLQSQLNQLLTQSQDHTGGFGGGEAALQSHTPGHDDPVTPRRGRPPKNAER